MAFNNVNNQLQYIAKKGNYVDIANAMALVYAYSQIYTTGQVPTIKRLRDGKEAAAVSGLESMLTGATSQTNSIHEFNLTRDAFFNYVATMNSDFYSNVDIKLFPRLGLTVLDVLPVSLDDCMGSLIANTGTIDIYVTTWNEKVDIDFALCNTRLNYLFNTGGRIGASYVLGESKIQPSNTSIPYNAPAVTNHRQRDEFVANRKELVAREAEVKPQAIAKYSNNNI